MVPCLPRHQAIRPVRTAGLPGKVARPAAAGAGSAAAAVLCLVVRYAIPIPAGGNLAIFLDSGRLALAPNLGDMLLLVLLIGLIAAAFSFFPARRGGRLRPVEALNATF